jgi:hypothetical protein
LCISKSLRGSRPLPVEIHSLRSVRRGTPSGHRPHWVSRRRPHGAHRRIASDACAPQGTRSSEGTGAACRCAKRGREFSCRRKRSRPAFLAEQTHDGSGEEGCSDCTEQKAKSPECGGGLSHSDPLREVCKIAGSSREPVTVKISRSSRHGSTGGSRHGFINRGMRGGLRPPSDGSTAPTTEHRHSGCTVVKSGVINVRYSGAQWHRHAAQTRTWRGRVLDGALGPRRSGLEGRRDRVELASRAQVLRL